MLCVSILILASCAAFGQPYPYASPFAAAPPVAAATVPPAIPPTAYPGGPARPLLPGLPGYNNPYYNQYNSYNQYNRYNQYDRSPGAAVPILTYSNEHVGDGTYSFSFTTADGKQAQEAGYLKDAYIDNAGEPQGTQVVQGSYAYISPEGIPIQVTYVADENGFRPSGVHIPANGSAVSPLVGNKENQLVDPLYQRYNPYRYRGRLDNFGPYNRSYDPRYPYNSAKYNPIYNNRYLTPTETTKASV